MKPGMHNACLDDSKQQLRSTAASQERHLETLVRQQMAKFGKDGEHERLRRKMFERIVRSESVSDYLQRFGIHVSRLEDVFGLMDWERQGRPRSPR